MVHVADDGFEPGQPLAVVLERMARLETFIRYMDRLIAMNKPIEVEIKETAA